MFFLGGSVAVWKTPAGVGGFDPSTEVEFGAVPWGAVTCSAAQGCPEGHLLTAVSVSRWGGPVWDLQWAPPALRKVILKLEGR